VYRCRAEAAEEHLLSHFNLREICLLYMAKATNLSRQASQLNGELVIGRRQVGEDFINQLLVFAD
jgi:hypothetical protein